MGAPVPVSGGRAGSAFLDVLSVIEAFRFRALMRGRLDCPVSKPWLISDLANAIHGPLHPNARQ